MKKIFFFDLDNTIYFTEPNKESLMSGLYSRLDQEKLNLSPQEYDQAKQDMMRIPFPKVAEQNNFPKAVIKRLTSYLSEREINEPLIPSDDYRYIKALVGRKFIVTAGFPKQQLAKVKMLGIEKDFEEVRVVDITSSNKKEVFAAMITDHKLDKSEILVIGDDADSEIKAGLELGLETFLLDPDHRFPDARSTFKGRDLKTLPMVAG